MVNTIGTTDGMSTKCTTLNRPLSSSCLYHRVN